VRKPVLLIFANACILIVVFVLLAQSLFIVQRVAVARNVSGQVAVQRGGAGNFTPIVAGAALKSGDAVRTGAKSEAEFAWQDGTRWKLSPNSSLTIQTALFNPAKKSEVSRLRLESGRILVRVVRPMPLASRFEIETPNALTTVRGTILSVAVIGTETQVKVFQGRVDVSDAGGTRIASITPGQKVRASLLDFKTSPDTDQSEFLAQPTFLKPELQIQARPAAPGTALITGQTEAGNRVTIGGAKVPVLPTGRFFKRVKVGDGQSKWKIESTDKHGAKTVVWQAPPAASDTGYPTQN
jgi:hypothetical protein